MWVLPCSSLHKYWHRARQVSRSRHLGLYTCTHCRAGTLTAYLDWRFQADRDRIGLPERFGCGAEMFSLTKCENIICRPILVESFGVDPATYAGGRRQADKPPLESTANVMRA